MKLGSTLMISIIIPIWNEESVLIKNEDYFLRLARVAELIFVDGGSQDRSRELAGRYGRVVQSPKGRSVQMNAGARLASHEILFFLHADCRIDPQDLPKVAEAISKGILAGCFIQRIDHPDFIFRWIAWTGNWRARWLKIFYGDQGLFVRRDKFWEAGGYLPVTLGEDVLLSKKLRAMGLTRPIPCRIDCSARRWLQNGIIRTFLLNLRITWFLLKGNDPQPLASFYADIR